MKKRYVKELLGITIAAVLFARLPVYTLAGDYYIEDGNITVHAQETGQTIAQGSGSPQEDNEPVISNRNPDTPSSNTVTISAEAGQTANVTLDDVNIDASGEENTAAVKTEGEGNVNIEIDGDNTVKSGINSAGIQKKNNGELTISDIDKNGSLSAYGGAMGAGIGGGCTEKGKDITIEGGKVTAIGGQYAAGIGGGTSAGGENITIKGGEITASGNFGGAGIGGGSSGTGKSISIEGGEVIATGGDTGAGIGGGTLYNGEIIKIEGGKVIAIGGTDSAGIGGGTGGKGLNITISKDSCVSVAGGEYSYMGIGAAIGNGAGVGGSELEIIPDTSGLYITGSIIYFPTGTTAEQITKGEVQPTKIIVKEEAPADPGTQGGGQQGGNPGAQGGQQGGNPAQGGQQAGTEPTPVEQPVNNEPQEAPAVGHSSSESSDGDNSVVKEITTSSEELAKFLAQTNSTLEAYIKKIEAMAAAGDTEGLNELISKGITLETGNWVCFNKKTYTLIERVSELGAPVRISFGYKGIRYSTTIPGKAEIKPTDLCNAEGYCGFLNLIKYYGKEEK